MKYDITFLFFVFINTFACAQEICDTQAILEQKNIVEAFATPILYNHYNVTNSLLLLQFFQELYGISWTTYYQEVTMLETKDKSKIKRFLCILEQWKTIVLYVKRRYFNNYSAKAWYLMYYTFGDLVSTSASYHIQNFIYFTYLQEHLVHIERLLTLIKFHNTAN